VTPSLPTIGHIHLDPLGGIAGDMFIAALTDAFPDLVAVVEDAVGACGVPEDLRLHFARRHTGTLDAATFHVLAPAVEQHPSGDYPDIVALLEAAPLADAVRGHALAIYRHLAEAEAAVHGVALDDVHFHELADWDSLVDIVGAAALLAALPDASWSCAPLPLGRGTVETAHGRLPVPAPAVAHLLQGFPVFDDGLPGERVTPTGAAILCHLQPSVGGAGGVMSGTGLGAGTRELEGVPNVLRALAFAAATRGTETVAALTFELDDATPEELSVGLDALRRVDGVLDVACFTGMGKKGRAVFHVQVLAQPEARDRALDACLAQTPTLGVRQRLETRRVLAREAVSVPTEAGPVRVKVAARPGGDTAKAEMDDVAGDDDLRTRRDRRAAAERQALHGKRDT
jgi:uncharacterized protein (TIGR00299 family) protein